MLLGLPVHADGARPGRHRPSVAAQDGALAHRIESRRSCSSVGRIECTIVLAASSHAWRMVPHCLPVDGGSIGTFVAHLVIAFESEADVVLRPNGSGVFRFLETAACKA